MKLRLAPEAIEDITGIKQYIREELGNPAASNRIAGKIVKSYKQLKASPYIVAPLRSKVSFETTMRFLVTGNYLIFYDVNEKESFVEITRILHGKRNFLKILFQLDEVSD